MLALFAVVADFNLAMMILNWAIHLNLTETSGYKMEEEKPERWNLNKQLKNINAST
ncbi:hypothetical protein [Niallia circulans]|uniref:hypothetical protein n=1 Tax=Niallia circulans TaxID=1397 RepID=UPI001F1C039B|nr:hypothetical protein [Niallia circulans]